MCAAAESGANIEWKKYISFALLASKRLMNTVRELSMQPISTLALALEEYPLKLQVLATLVAMGLDVDKDWFRSKTCNYVLLFDKATIKHPAVKIIVKSGWSHDSSTTFFNSVEQQTTAIIIAGCRRSGRKQHQKHFHCDVLQQTLCVFAYNPTPWRELRDWTYQTLARNLLLSA